MGEYENLLQGKDKFRFYKKERDVFVKLNKYVVSLKNAQQKILEKMDICTSKMDAIEEKAGDIGRDLTASEWERFFSLKEMYVDLEGEYNDIQKAIECIDCYCDGCLD